MLHIVVYDIANPRRLRRSAKTCERYGVRVEKSVFEADLGDEEFADFWRHLRDDIDETEDSLIAYRVCRACARDIQTAGVAIRPQREECVVI